DNANGTQVGNYFKSLKNSHQNTITQAMGLALSVWVTTTGLGWNTSSTGPTHYGVHHGTGGTGLGTVSYSVGTNGASFGVPNNTMLTVNAILSYFNSQATVVTPGNFTTLRTWTFYGGNGTLLTGAGTVMETINLSNDI